MTMENVPQNEKNLISHNYYVQQLMENQYAPIDMCNINKLRHWTTLQSGV